MIAINRFVSFVNSHNRFDNTLTKISQFRRALIDCSFLNTRSNSVFQINIDCKNMNYSMAFLIQKRKKSFFFSTIYSLVTILLLKESFCSFSISLDRNLSFYLMIFLRRISLMLVVSSYEGKIKI